jgi:hypothetical protein
VRPAKRTIGVRTVPNPQAHVDALKLHDDFVSCLKARFESMRLIPAVLEDIATGIKLAAAERK